MPLASSTAIGIMTMAPPPALASRQHRGDGGGSEPPPGASPDRPLTLPPPDDATGPDGGMSDHADGGRAPALAPP
jgi:hypothetical protein